MTHKRHIEALHHLATGEPVHFRAVSRLRELGGPLHEKGRTVKLPNQRVHKTR